MSELTKIHLTKEQVSSAIMSANRIVMSPHEWAWTQEEQQEMAMMILWVSAENSKLLEKYKKLLTKFNAVFDMTDISEKSKKEFEDFFKSLD